MVQFIMMPIPNDYDGDDDDHIGDAAEVVEHEGDDVDEDDDLNDR